MNIVSIKRGQKFVYFTTSPEFPTWFAACHSVHENALKYRETHKILRDLYEDGHITLTQRKRKDGLTDYLAVGI